MNKSRIKEVCIFIPKSKVILVKTNLEELADVMRYLTNTNKNGNKVSIRYNLDSQLLDKVVKHMKKIGKKFDPKDKGAGTTSGYYILVK